jgi:hypothetical protein
VRAIAALKAGIAGHLTILDATEECLKGALDAQHHILQDLGIDVGVFGHRLLDAGQFGLLLKVGAATPRMRHASHRSPTAAL